MKWTKEEELRLLELLESGLSDARIADILTTEFKRTLTRSAVCNKRNFMDLPSSQDVPMSFDVQVTREKSLLKKKQALRAEQYAVRETAKYEMLLDTIKEAVTPLEFTIPKVEYKKDAKQDPETAIALISDTHDGKLSRYYNLDIAASRFTQYANSVLSIVNLQRNSIPINDLVIIFNGDIVDGDGVYPTHQHHLDANLVNQIFQKVPEKVAAIAKLAANFDTVRIIGVPGNHGRVSKFAHEEDNFDRIYYLVMQMATSHLPNVTWELARDWYYTFMVYRHRFFAMHGDQIKMTLNLPWYGITTRISRLITTAGIDSFDVACLGHFHTSSRLRWNKVNIFTNGTMVDGDEFALEKLGLESSQCQWLFGVSEKRATTWAYEISFEL